MDATFLWTDAADWVAEVRRRLVASHGSGVLTATPERPPGPLGSAALWLQRLLGDETPEPAAALIGGLVQEFRRRYGEVRAFHAGRPADPASFQQEGIRLSSPEWAAAEAHRLFCGPEPPRVDPWRLDQVLTGDRLEVFAGRLGLNLDQRFLLTSFTFYAIYGSHTLMVVAAALQQATGQPFLAHLRSQGVPTVVECTVPAAQLSSDAAERICCGVLREALWISRNGELGITDLDFRLRRPVPSDWIVACRHPTGLDDHLYGHLQPTC